MTASPRRPHPDPADEGFEPEPIDRDDDLDQFERDRAPWWPDRQRRDDGFDGIEM